MGTPESPESPEFPPEVIFVLSPSERDGIRAAYTDRNCRAVDAMQEDGGEVDVSLIPELDLRLSLLDQDEVVLEAVDF